MGRSGEELQRLKPGVRGGVMSWPLKPCPTKKGAQADSLRHESRAAQPVVLATTAVPRVEAAGRRSPRGGHVSESGE
jgi:hypothetical protein